MGREGGGLGFFFLTGAAADVCLQAGDLVKEGFDLAPLALHLLPHLWKNELIVNCNIL